MVISYSSRRFEVFLKVPVIIIIRFEKNDVLGTIYIDIYEFWGWAGYILYILWLLAMMESGG